MDDKERYIQLGLTLGADDVVPLAIADIVFDPRTLLKCMYGCADWGRNHTCPSRPGALLPWQYRRILRRYSWGLLVHAGSKRTSQEVSFELERQAFLDGYYFAFSLSDCALCKECAGHKGVACVNPRKARPAFHSVGIDVFATAKKHNLPIKTLDKPDAPQNWYAAVFVE
ncbi:MAG: DUF2284 domain-containing protein [Phycisphaerae bacterium]|nr:DUF2284 domain-containing protein [Phycisphaerae bacterium]